MVKLIVSYPTTPGATFDETYYMASHMPMVDTAFAPYGMTGWAVVFPDQPDAPYAAIATLDFRDDAAFAAATGSPDAAAVFADVANFTTITPVTMKARAA
jgi:uncharacterized protein (TIGR02118 family)